MLLVTFHMAPAFCAITDNPFSCTGFLRFKSGTFGDYGPIKAFHTYGGQNEKRHSHYDGISGDLPLPQKLNSFNNILGARNAIDAGIKLTNLVATKRKWDDGVRQFLSDEIFALDVQVRPGNTEVDPHGQNDNILHLQQITVRVPKESEQLGLVSDNKSNEGDQISYSVSMARKLTLLERGFAGIDAPEDFSNDRFRFLSHARHWYNRSWLKTTVLRLNVATLLGLVAGMILFGFLLVWPRA